MEWRRGLVGAGAAVALITAGCSTSADPPASPASATATSSAAPDEPSAQPDIVAVELSQDIEHVHGLVDTDTVVAGTHTGARLVTRDGAYPRPARIGTT